MWSAFCEIPRGGPKGRRSNITSSTQTALLVQRNLQNCSSSRGHNLQCVGVDEAVKGKLTMTFASLASYLGYQVALRMRKHEPCVCHGAHRYQVRASMHGSKSAHDLHAHTQ